MNTSCYLGNSLVHNYCQLRTGDRGAIHQRFIHYYAWLYIVETLKLRGWPPPDEMPVLTTRLQAALKPFSSCQLNKDSLTTEECYSGFETAYSRLIWLDQMYPSSYAFSIFLECDISISNRFVLQERHHVSFPLGINLTLCKSQLSSWRLVTYISDWLDLEV